MKTVIFILILITIISTAGCTLQTIEAAKFEPEAIISNGLTGEETSTPTVSPAPAATVTAPPIVMVEPTPPPTETSAPPPTPTESAGLVPTLKPMPDSTEQTAATQTPEPTAEPTAEPATEPEITAVSPSFINAAMAKINSIRQENGVEPAALVSSISSDCKAHAIEMAEAGSPFHDSNPGGCEAVGRVSDAMPGSTVGSTAVTHVSQLATSDVSKIGIGAVYCNGYLYFVVRGLP